MKIFSDLHHSGLFYSFKLTLEDRLGHELYRPVGMEWFEQGMWDIAKPYKNSPDTAKQYLDLNETYYPPDGSPPLNRIVGETPTHYLVDELFHNYKQKALTLDQFREMDIDVIIASIPDHYETYRKLRDRYHPDAKLICHAGNIGWNDIVIHGISEGVIKNFWGGVLQSFTPGCNYVFTHEEMPSEAYTPPRPILDPFRANRELKIIKSFCHLLPLPELWNQYKKAFDDVFEMKAFGSGCPDGAKAQLQDIYDEMRDSTYVYHVKPGGDGFGWNWHSAYMMGRPMITNWSDYQDKLGGLLFVHKENGINLEAGTVEENCRLIKEFSDPEKHQWMCRNARKKFEEVVNYAAEGYQVRKFLENLTS